MTADNYDSIRARAEDADARADKVGVVGVIAGILLFYSVVVWSPWHHQPTCVNSADYDSGYPCLIHHENGTAQSLYIDEDGLVARGPIFQEVPTFERPAAWFSMLFATVAVVSFLIWRHETRIRDMYALSHWRNSENSP